MSYRLGWYDEWEGGKMYRYWMKIKGGYNGEVKKEDVGIDVE